VGETIERHEATGVNREGGDDERIAFQSRYSQQ
jgi:hypothetical protein